MALAAAGLLDPSVAAFIHVASEMTFILNSARLLPRTRSATEPAMGLQSQENTLAKAA
jgi:Cd2+/Zn2+-exporting ATPase/Cu+-exporting ATPase